MRNTTLFVLLGIAALAVMPACTVHDVDAPAMSGPSTFANSITLRTNTSTLIQDGVSQATITITAVDAQGNPKNIPMRAEIRVGNVAQDFGRLSTKQPTANGTPLVYTAPPPSALAAGQVSQTVQIFVTPVDSGDFASEIPRFVDIQLVPQGIILPTNPNLVAAFTVSPASPQVLQTATFDASTTTNGGSACGVSCLYTWNFGDNTTGTGITLTHQYRTINTYNATLTVTDTRGATATSTKSIAVAAGTPPTAQFTVSPQNPGVEQDVFFNATQSTPGTAERTIVSYEWSFGDGDSARGVVVTKKYHAPGTYTVQLTTTDDAGTIGRSAATQLTVGPPVTAAPTASLDVTPASPKPNVPAVFDASGSKPGSGANIVSYVFNYGDGSPTETVTNPVQSHKYTGAGTFAATVTVTDSLGRTASASKSVVVAP
jgi:PKD repeat protein